MRVREVEDMIPEVRAEIMKKFPGTNNVKQVHVLKSLTSDPKKNGRTSPMPSSKERSTEAMQQALNVWGHYTTTFERFGLLYEVLLDLDDEAETMQYFYGCLERHVQAQRVKHLDEHWGGLDNGTPAQAEQIALPHDEMLKLHAIVGFYGIPRAFMFLYLHAYLWKQIFGTGPYGQIKMIVDGLDPR